MADWLLLYTWFGLSLPEDPREKLLTLLAIIIVWPLVLGGHALTNAEMNGPFVLASRVSSPRGRMVMVRSGGLVFSAALHQSGWALISGSGETSIPNPPEEWWLGDASAKEMGLDIDTIEAERRTLII